MGLKSDVVFKLILANKDNEFILVDIINTLLMGKVTIKSATVKDREVPKTFIKDKSCMLDILCEDEYGNIYNIEMQRLRHKGVIERFFIYNYRHVSRQLKIKDSYTKLKPVISIFLLDFNLFDDSIFHDIVTPCSKRRPDLDFSHISEIHFIELRKFKTTELITDYDKWLYFFNNSEQLARGEITVPETLKNKEAIMGALEDIYKVNSKEVNQIRIINREIFLADQATIMEEGLEKGREKGRAEGKAEGRSEGRAEGKLQQALQIYQSNIVTLEVAKKLIQEELGKGYDDLVQEYLAKLEE